MWTLHATRMPELRDAILAGQFQRLACPECGRAVVAEPTLLYTDFDRHQWYGTFPTNAVKNWGAIAQKVRDGFQHNMMEACPPLVREWAPHFQVRAVFGLAALREKLLLHEAGIDDRWIELVKLRMLRDTAAPWLNVRTRVWLDQLDDEGLDFTVVGPNAADGTEVVHRIRVVRGALDEIVQSADRLANTWPELFEGVAVDWRILFASNSPLPEHPKDDEQLLLDHLYNMAPR